MKLKFLIKLTVVVCCLLYLIFHVIVPNKWKNLNSTPKYGEVGHEEIVVTTTKPHQQEANQTPLEKRLPDALIIGVMKGGTSMLQKFIFIHPNVKGLVKGEIHFFSFRFNKGFSWYLDQLEAARNGEIVMEKSMYFHHKMASQRIWKTFDKNIKLILIVKDPVERLLSHYTMAFANSETDRNFSQLAFTNENGKLAVNTRYNPVQMSNYADQMALWLSSGFDLSNFLIIDGHKFVKDPWPELFKLENFLGLRHMLSKEMFYLNETKGFYCVMPNFTFADGTPSNHKGGCGHPKCGREHPILNDEERNLLYQYYAPKNQEFSKMVDMEFPDWDLHKKLQSSNG